MAKETYSKPSEVVVENGRVLIDGPDGVDVALTPEAAEETGIRLTGAAARAAEHNRRQEQEGDDQPED